MEWKRGASGIDKGWFFPESVSYGLLKRSRAKEKGSFVF